MPDADPRTIYLADYTPPNWLIESVHLSFVLSPGATRVRSAIRFYPNPKSADQSFQLDGVDLTLIRAAIDGTEVTPTLTPSGLICDVPTGPFLWEAEVEINPLSNTELEGLYISDDVYCTQCEAEGFRRITYYPDRPDVMAPFTVRIEGDTPVLLSNGNPVGAGAGWAEWHDPWPKPAYLFALVAGDLAVTSDQFTTSEGRDVALNIYALHSDIDKCAYAMDALKRSMLWDEQVYGRAYDLDVFNIVAVSAFNGGAMENKGLNIFNTALVLASADTSTDSDFERVESVIAHEYFHNWTGNRITCRDWFQLSLKEGLTVFRDQQFTSDMRSAAVKRIEDAVLLRAHQFREDAGPLAHPVRPDHFVEINNFYTTTVYEKGAEVISMLRHLVGADDYARAVDLYFRRHDGQACTVEDWLKAFEDTTGRDLSQFKRWYEQAGTPLVTVQASWADGQCQITLRQHVPATPGQQEKHPMVIPVAVGILDDSGAEQHATEVLELTETEQSFTLPCPQPPVLSLLRGFSAPVRLDTTGLPDHRALLLTHDSDPFARAEAARGLARDGLIAMVRDGADAPRPLLEGLHRVALDAELDPAYRALLLQMPSEDSLAQSLHEGGITPDPERIHAAREQLLQALAEGMSGDLPSLYATHQRPGPYSPDAEDAGHRALGNAALGLISRLDDGAQAAQQFEQADNMTQSLAALAQLIRLGRADTALSAFHERWKEDRLVMDKWFGIQISQAPGAKAVQIATELTQHPLFDIGTPNRVRAVLGALMGHPTGFHQANGTGYRLIADFLLRLDSRNSQLAARISAGFQTWRRYDADRQDLIRTELERIQNRGTLSPDLSEMLSRMLAD